PIRGIGAARSDRNGKDEAQILDHEQEVGLEGDPLNRLDQRARVCENGVGIFVSHRNKVLADERVKIDTLEEEFVHARTNPANEEVGPCGIGVKESIGGAANEYVSIAQIRAPGGAGQAGHLASSNE